MREPVPPDHPAFDEIHPAVDPTIVALFRDRANALLAFTALNRMGFAESWLGVATGMAESGEPIVEPVGYGLLDSLGYFFGEGRQTLTRALRRRGIGDRLAEAVGRRMERDDAVVTVDAGNDVSDVVAILRRFGGTPYSGTPEAAGERPSHSQPSAGEGFRW
jgi:hypothetical protein